MSQISSAHKVENMNKTALQQLQSILEFCEKYGYQPEPDSDFGAIMRNMYHFMLMRKAKGIATPKEIPSLYAKIKTFPTAVKQKRKELKIKEAAKQSAQQLTFKQKYIKIQNLTSHNLDIFKFFCGGKKFEYFLKTDIDPIVTKAVLDYFYAIYYNPRLSIFMGKHIQRTRNFIELYVGDYTDKNIDDLKDNLRCRARAKDLPQMPEKDYLQQFAKIENKEPLTHKEIGYLHFMTGENVSRILGAARKDFHKAFKDLESLLNSYLKGDASAVMSKIPARFVKLYKYQQDKKIQDIPTDVLNNTGKTMLELFAKSNFENQH